MSLGSTEVIRRWLSLIILRLEDKSTKWGTTCGEERPSNPYPQACPPFKRKWTHMLLSEQLRDSEHWPQSAWTQSFSTSLLHQVIRSSPVLLPAHYVSLLAFSHTTHSSHSWNIFLSPPCFSNSSRTSLDLHLKSFCPKNSFSLLPSWSPSELLMALPNPPWIQHLPSALESWTFNLGIYSPSRL